jgi:serine/threonine protein phosphatase PrpC
MNILNFYVNKEIKNYSKNKQKNKQFILPSLNPTKENKVKNFKMPYQFGLYKNPNINRPIKDINYQLKKQKNNIQNKINSQNQLLKNHKPYSGNPSIKCNNNIAELNKPLKNNNNQYNSEREIFTANPSLIASKINFNNKRYIHDNCNNNINNNNHQIALMPNKSNNKSNVNLYNYRNDFNDKENLRENISAKYQYYQDKAHKFYKKLTIGISKSSPKFSSIDISSKQYENQKQKDNDFQKNIKIVRSYKNENNLKNNLILFRKNSNIKMDKNINEYNKYLNKEKNKQYNLGNIGGSLNNNIEAQNMLIKAVGKMKLQFEQKHINLKSASIIKINNPIKDEYTKNKKNNNIKLLKNNSKQNLNSSINNQSNVNAISNNTYFSTISPHSVSINNNSSIKGNDINDYNNKNNKPKISKNFISYAYTEYPNLEHRQEMEDFHCIKQALGKNENLSYFSIFDGHGGREVASFLSLNLHRKLVQEINSVSFSNNDEDNINLFIEVIKNAFDKIDKDIIDNNNFSIDVGSTASIIFIYYNNKENNEQINNNKKKNIKRTIICANVGDSNGFLINKKYIKLMTKAHKCDDVLEVKRIKGQGGIVFQGRIFGKLILTRTLGDKEMKKYGVIPTPDFFVKKIEDDDIFFIIGSDGIWDVIDQEEVYRMGIEKGISSEEFSKKLINIAKERDTRDNASCIVIKLNKNI